MEHSPVSRVPSKGPAIRSTMFRDLVFFLVGSYCAAVRLAPLPAYLLVFIRRWRCVLPDAHLKTRVCLRWQAAFVSQQIVTLAFGAKHIPFGMLFIANDFGVPVIYIG